MFKRKEASLPKDPVFPVDLEKLGYHLNENGLIRSNLMPESQFMYRITNSERYNLRNGQAMDSEWLHGV